jgi:hypothetical protein
VKVQQTRTATSPTDTGFIRPTAGRGGVAPKAEVDLGSFRASLLTGTRSVSITEVILIALIWVAIAVVNVAYARRHPGRF